MHRYLGRITDHRTLQATNACGLYSCANCVAVKSQLRQRAGEAQQISSAGSERPGHSASLTVHCAPVSLSPSYRSDATRRPYPSLELDTSMAHHRLHKLRLPMPLIIGLHCVAHLTHPHALPHRPWPYGHVISARPERPFGPASAHFRPIGGPYVPFARRCPPPPLYSTCHHSPCASSLVSCVTTAAPCSSPTPPCTPPPSSAPPRVPP